MLTQTFAQLQTKVQNNVIDLPSTVTGVVADLVNYAHRQLQIDHNYKVMEALATPFTQVGQRTLVTVEGCNPSCTQFAVPAGFKEYRDLPWFLRNDGSIGYMNLANKREDIWKSIDEADVNFPLILLQNIETDSVGDGVWNVYPLPDGNSDYPSGEYHIQVPYWSYLADLVNTGDNDWFTNQGNLYIEFKATAEAFMRNHDPQNAALWEQKAGIEERLLLKRDKLLRLSTGSNTFVPLWHGVRSPKLQW